MLAQGLVFRGLGVHLELQMLGLQLLQNLASHSFTQVPASLTEETAPRAQVLTHLMGAVRG